MVPFGQAFRFPFPFPRPAPIPDAAPAASAGATRFTGRTTASPERVQAILSRTEVSPAPSPAATREAEHRKLMDSFYQFAQAPATSSVLAQRAQELECWGDILDARAAEQPDGALKTECENAADMARRRAEHLNELQASSPFNVKQMFESRAAYWDAAGKAVDTLIAAQQDGGTASAARTAALEGSRARFVQRARLLRDAPGKFESPIGNPREIMGRAKSKPSPKQVAEVMAGKVSYGVPCDERALAIGCLKEAMTEANGVHQASGGAKAPKPASAKKLFAAQWNRYLNTRPNDTIRTNIALLVSADKSSQAVQLKTLRCEQIPARLATARLTKEYRDDGLESSNCHDIAQHRHATNLYHSRLLDADGRSMLDLVRHGALSASAFTRTGIAQMSDDELGQVALDMAPDLGDSRLKSMLKLPLKDRLSAAARYVRGQAEGPPRARFLRLFCRRPLLERMRSHANQTRAREAVEVALSTLPAQRIRAMAKASGGKMPEVTMCSVSLMSPDWARDITPGENAHKRNERRMWNDQTAAFKSITEAVVDMPDDQGRVRPMKVRVKMLPMNFAVNEWGTRGVVSEAAGIDVTRRANAQMLEVLLGREFYNQTIRTRFDRAPSWAVGGQVGAALATITDAAKRDRIEQLARQVGELFISGDYLRASADPYKMASRLAVLSQLIGMPTLLNCKSGKDRTTEAEAQARHLRIQIEAGHLPRPGAPRTDLEKLQLRDLHLNGGSRQIQLRSTNHVGTKLGYFADLHGALYGLAAGDEAFDDVRGRSKFVSS